MDPDIFTLARDCLRSFAGLSKALLARPTAPALMPPEAVDNECARFRVWCGNLGALQQSFASLDYRLRESPVMLASVCKLLQQLRFNLVESISVVSGARPAFEDQAQPASGESSDVSDDSDDDDHTPGNCNELSMRLSTIVDLVRKLYELGFKIRDPRLRPSSKASLYREVDQETGVDLFEAFAEFDQRRVDTLLYSLRQGRQLPTTGDPDYLVPRLVASTTLRRKNFRYWEKHGKKLSLYPGPDSRIQPATAKSRSASQAPGAEKPPSSRPGPLKTGEQKTLLSMTEATKYQENVDDRTERGTVMSYASTALDADGHCLELPNAPPEAREGKDFVCPYCSVMCPAKYGQGRAWRSHVLHDLQPYICTYQDCSQPHQLYQSRRQWVEHESSQHRRLYRCYEHGDLLYQSPERLRAHLQRDHAARLTEAQMDSLVGLSAVSVSDERPHCPICFEPAPFAKGMENHLAHHLERFAMFALPKSLDGDATSTTDKPASQKMGGRSRDSGESLDRPVFSDHGAPNDRSSDGSVESGFRQETGTAHDDDNSPQSLAAEDGKGSQKCQEEEPEEQSGQALDDGDKVEDMTRRALTYLRQGQWMDAERLQLQVTEANKRKLGETHPDTLASMGNLALMYEIQGRWEEAEALYLGLVATQQNVLGKEHPDTMTSMDKLAKLRRRQGSRERPEALWLHLISLRREVLGEEHPVTLASLGSLASTYMDHGRWGEAEALWLGLIATRRKALGEEHPDTLASLGSLASTYSHQGRWGEAEAIWLQLIPLRRKALGDEHPATLDSLDCLALIYSGQERWGEAETLLLELITTRRKVLGEEHPDTLDSLGSLALTYSRQGRWGEAETLLLELITTRRKVLGEEHPGTLASLRNLASIYSRQGRWGEAEDLFVRAIGSFRAKRGDDVFPLARQDVPAMADPSSIYSAQGRFGEAKKLDIEVMESSMGLASIYSSQGRLEEAEKLQVEVLRKSKEMRGERHPRTFAIMEQLACTWNLQGRLEEAINLMRQCAQLEEEVLGSDHARTRNSLDTLRGWLGEKLEVDGNDDV